MIEKVVPATRAKWPDNTVGAKDLAEDNKNIIAIQEDNATPHGGSEDLEWKCLLVDPNERVLIESREQPANSPDTNLCDLGFFRALAANYWQQSPATTINELIANVEKAYNEYDPILLNRIWLTHASVCDQIIVNNGGNDFKIPLMGKERLEREGRLPSLLPLSSKA